MNESEFQELRLDFETQLKIQEEEFLETLEDIRESLFNLDQRIKNLERGKDESSPN